MKSIVVLYHNDGDGFGGAWAAWKKFKNKASYIPVEYNNKNEPPEFLKDKEIYLIDVCYSVKQMGKILAENKKVVVLDHHETSRQASKISTEHRFEIKSSAAILAWRYFHPKKKIPKLLSYINDFDLWLFKLKETKQISAVLEIYNNKFEAWEKVAKDLENSRTRKKYLEQGDVILKYQNKLVNFIIRQAIPVDFEGKKALAVNSNILESEVGNGLIQQGAEVGIIWFIKNSSQLKVSLRSNPKKIDVSKLALRHGGGGHKGAAGFTIKFKDEFLFPVFPWKIK